MTTTAYPLIAFMAQLLIFIGGAAGMWLSVVVLFISLRLLLRGRFRRGWRRQLKKLRKWAIALLLLYTCILGFLWTIQPRLLYFPSHIVPATPASHNIRYENVWIPATPTRYPEHLHSWWIPHPQGPIGTLIYFHGADRNIGFNVDQAYWLKQLGFNVLLVEYHGYGLSEGHFPTEASLYEDAEAALTYLTQARGISAEEIFVYGHSLGGAIAINLATHHPDLAGLIIQNSFTSIADMVRRFRYAHAIPMQWLLNQRFESLQKASSLRVPILLIHAKGDPLVPVTMAEQLYRAVHSFKDLVLVESNVHDNAAAQYKDIRYLIKIQTFALKALSVS